MDNGGPVYPISGQIVDTSPAGEMVYLPGSEGMTLLDCFAGQAMCAIIGKLPPYDTHELAGEGLTPQGLQSLNTAVSLGAYDYADAMIAEKRRRESQ